MSFERLTVSVIVPHILLQITFLEFFEVLLGSTEVKCQQVSVSQEGQSLPSPKDLPEGEASEKILQTTDSPAQVRLFLEPLMPSVHLTTLCKECSYSSKLCLQGKAGNSAQENNLQGSILMVAPWNCIYNSLTFLWKDIQIFHIDISIGPPLLLLKYSVIFIIM